MAGQIQGGGGDQFDFYFRRADLNGDGRISGAEAVAFFQGSNLPKQVLAQIWMHADQNRTGFLGRPEFYNALKLVTVAQSKRDLTPDIVKAALFGPAAAKIPPPQINLPAIPQQNAMAIPQQNAMGLSQQNAMALSQQNEMALTPQNAMATPLQNAMAITPANAMAAPVSQMRPAAPMQPHNLGIRGQVPPNATMNQNYLASQQNQSMLTRPPLSAGLPANTHAAPPPQQELGRGNSFVGPNTPSSNLSTGWFSGNTPSSTAPQDIPRGTTSAVHPVTSQAQNLVLASVEQGLKDSKISAVSGNGFAPNTVFGNDVFSAAPTLNKQDLNTISPSSMNTPSMSAVVPASTGLQSQAKLGSLDSLQTDFTMQPANSQLQRAPVNPNQHVLAQSTPTQPSRISAGPVNSSPDQSQMSWPKMKPSDVQKYTKVFVEVDSDRDGKITGEQARNLFMSWRLPREVLKQVWDLSDQDNDSMLSLREFCIALYLMERYREGRALPAALPSNVLFDETLSSSTGLPASSYGNASWGANPGLRQQPGAQPGVPITSTAGLRAPVRAGAPHPNESVLPDQNKRDSELEEEDPFAHFGSRKPKPKKVHEEKVTEKKVEGAANSLMDSKEKIEFYRMMMQELVLYKSRCDNRLNEITERALADKREAESLGKKYEEKYKQVADIASKLTIEEAKFRETQERKMELQQAIIKMEQGGSADGLLQVRADRIQSDADELMKALTERCKIHGLNINSAALFELPKGWQPGIQEGAAVWDEEWDKFEDEGFSFAKDIKRDSQNNTSGKSNSGSVLLEKGSPESVITASHLDADGKSEKLFRDGESAYSPSEDDLERSSHGSPDRRGSPAREFSYHSRKSTEADAETYRAFDEPSWGNFDSNEDVDSVWGFNPTNTKDLDSENRENYFFGSGDLGSDSVRSGSPQLDPFQKKSPFVFADSVPSTPHSKFGNSPLRYGEGSTDHFFDTSSRFDSLSIQDGGYSPRCESLSRFDSVNSSRDFGHDRSFTSFDDADPFGSSGPFKVSSERESSRKDSGSWNAF